MQRVDESFQLGLVLTLQQVLNQICAIPTLGLAMDEVFNYLVPMQNLLYASQCKLGIFRIQPAKRGR